MPRNEAGVADLDSFEGEFPARRAPWADVPAVGARGFRTQQRIMRASLEVFDEVGYHDAGIAQITQKADCSRPNFYQYFSSKEDVFRRLFDDLGHRLIRATDELPPISPDPAGWTALRHFVAVHGELYDRFAPLFHSLATAVAADEVVATKMIHVRDEMAPRLLAALRPAKYGRIDVMVPFLLLRAVTRAHTYREYLLEGRANGPARARVEDAATDVMHRTFFGPVRDVNLRPRRAQPRLVAPVEALAVLDSHDTDEPTGTVSRATRLRILHAGREAFAALGYYDVSVDEVVERAGVSHGTFYRYFANVDELFRLVAAHASRRVASMMAELPWVDVRSARGGSRVLRSWLHRHCELYADDNAIFRVWLEGNRFSPEFRAQGAAVMVQMYEPFVRHLQERELGDPEADAFVLFAILDQVNAPLSRFADERHLAEVLQRVLRRAFACVR